MQNVLISLGGTARGRKFGDIDFDEDDDEDDENYEIDESDDDIQYSTEPEKEKPREKLKVYIIHDIYVIIVILGYFKIGVD